MIDETAQVDIALKNGNHIRLDVPLTMPVDGLLGAEQPNYEIVKPVPAVVPLRAAIRAGVMRRKRLARLARAEAATARFRAWLDEKTR